MGARTGIRRREEQTVKTNQLTPTISQDPALCQGVNTDFKTEWDQLSVLKVSHLVGQTQKTLSETDSICPWLTLSDLKPQLIPASPILVTVLVSIRPNTLASLSTAPVPFPCFKASHLLSITTHQYFSYKSLLPTLGCSALHQWQEGRWCYYRELSKSTTGC